MTMLDLEPIKRRLAGLPPGPFLVDERGDGVWCVRQIRADSGIEVHIAFFRRRPGAVFTAHAPTDLAALIAELEAARAAVEEAHALLSERWGNANSPYEPDVLHAIALLDTALGNE